MRRGGSHLDPSRIIDKIGPNMFGRFIGQSLHQLQQAPTRLQLFCAPARIVALQEFLVSSGVEGATLRLQVGGAFQRNFFQPVAVEATVIRLRNRMGILRGIARVNGVRVIDGTMTFALAPAQVADAPQS